MPTQATARPFAAPMPTFMSVFGEEINREGSVGIASGSPVDVLKRPATAGNILQSPSSNNPAPFSIFHQHRDSTSTSASESTDSSPTTTISTIDSASMTEPSPGPSPESPALKTSPTSFVPDFRSRIAGTNAEAGQPPFFELQRPTTPAKKARNLKNLAVNTASASNLNRAISPAALPQLVTQVDSTSTSTSTSTTSAPVSPSFVKPPTPPKRRPSNLALTIQTPANSLLPTRLTIPSTPSLKRPPTLRHFQSSPSLPLCSPGMPPEGGMTLQPLRTFMPQPHGFSEVPFETEEEEDQEPNFDVPQSREEKPAAYPNGPICIYESGVYLYYEPSAEQASNYDVILNVASEVKNPFTVADEAAKRIVDAMDLDQERSKSEPTSTVNTVPADFAATALAGDATSTEQSNTPTTPKATPEKVDQITPQPVSIPQTQNRPEYIHIPWEHNTDIVPDLYKLVKIIEDRVDKKKRVLVHCQCGVSRSASLIVAYGLYKNPGISVQEAYDAVKKRSKWIGPNMNLIMQLQEFRNGLLRANSDRAFHNQVYGTRKPMSLLSPSHSLDGRRHSPFQADSSTGSRTPRTAPLPPDGIESAGLRASTGNMEAVSAGPFPAPWSPSFRRSWASPSASNFDLSPRQPAPFSPTDIPLLDTNIPPAPLLSASDDSIASSMSERVDSGTSESIEAELKSIQQVTLPGPTEPAAPAPAAPIEVVVEPMTAAVEPVEAAVEPAESPSARPISKVPNFSRQLLPMRLDAEDKQTSELAEPILSPRSEEFHMVPLRREDYDGSFGILSPHGPMQDVQPTQPAHPVSLEDALKSPTFGGFPAQPFVHQPAPIRLHVRDDDAGLMSPGIGGGFPKDPFALNPAPTRPPPAVPAPSEDAFGLMSPGLNGGFPKDPFTAPAPLIEPDLASPRSEEFHMTALQLPVEEESFGLTSPRAGDELHQPTFSRFFEKDTLNERHTILPQHVHPILPPEPSALSVNGCQFLGMDAAATAPSLPEAPSFESSTPTPTPAQPFPPPRIEETPPQETVVIPEVSIIEAAPVEAIPTEPVPVETVPVEPVPAETQPEQPQTPPRPTISLPSTSPRSTYLTTPPRHPTIRTRFSSPNLSQQRRLHKLQTEIETKLLPGRSPPRGEVAQTQDDTAALMSPRATEFTKNPFHFELPTETPIQRTHGFDFGFDPGNHHMKDAWTVQAAKDDPRSPVMAGSSPIVRNIWDVL